MGIVGYGVCRFGGGVQPAESPQCRTGGRQRPFPRSLRQPGQGVPLPEDLSFSGGTRQKTTAFEAVFVATDAASHARHCIEVLNHGKHVATAVPAALGSLEDADRLFEVVKKSGLKYMMFETSCFRADCYAMRQVYKAGGFGRLIYSEGEYYHYTKNPIGSYKDWRLGLPPLWYPTHSTAYYIGVTDKTFTNVSCVGFDAGFPRQPPPVPTATTTPSVTRSPSSRPAKAAPRACSSAEEHKRKVARPDASSVNSAGWSKPSTTAR